VAGQVGGEPVIAPAMLPGWCAASASGSNDYSGEYGREGNRRRFWLPLAVVMHLRAVRSLR
jgi:hypothetical protein